MGYFDESYDIKGDVDYALPGSIAPFTPQRFENPIAKQNLTPVSRVIQNLLSSTLSTPPGSLRQRLQTRKRELETVLEEISARLARVTDQLRELGKYPDIDPFEDGAILRFEKTFPGDDQKSYTYVAHRVDGRWYVSGSRAPQGVSWDKFVDFMGIGVKEVWHINSPKRSRGGVTGITERKVIW